MVDAPENHDVVARIGGFDHLLDRFARTDDVSLGFAEAKPATTSSDKANNAAIAATKTMRFIRPTFL
jgi:hypothetical protein